VNLQKINVEWEESALKRHQEWAINIATEYSPKHMSSYLNDIQNSISNIESNPLIGAEFPLPKRKFARRLVSGDGYSIFYELDSYEKPKSAVVFSVTRGNR
jgi:hypothetical protein